MHTIGNGAFELKAFNHAFKWLKLALETIETEDHELNEKISIIENLALAAFQVTKKAKFIDLFEIMKLITIYCTELFAPF